MIVVIVIALVIVGTRPSVYIKSVFPKMEILVSTMYIPIDLHVY